MSDVADPPDGDVQWALAVIMKPPSSVGEYDISRQLLSLLKRMPELIPPRGGEWEDARAALAEEFQPHRDLSERYDLLLQEHARLEVGVLAGCETLNINADVVYEAIRGGMIPFRWGVPDPAMRWTGPGFSERERADAGIPGAPDALPGEQVLIEFELLQRVEEMIRPRASGDTASSSGTGRHSAAWEQFIAHMRARMFGGV